MSVVRKMARQGDLIFRKVNTRVEDAPISKDGLILAHGEVTGHTHRAVGDGICVYDTAAGAKFIRALDIFDVVHEEHSPITFDKGTWQVIRQREYTPERIRTVED